jgi:hypothetical protein
MKKPLLLCSTIFAAIFVLIAQAQPLAPVSLADSKSTAPRVMARKPQPQSSQALTAQHGGTMASGLY